MKGHSTQQLEHVCMIVLRHSGRVKDCHPCHSCLWEESEGRGCHHLYTRSQVVAYDCVHLLSKSPCPSPKQGLVAAVLEGAHHSADSLTPNLKASRGEAERVALEQAGYDREDGRGFGEMSLGLLASMVSAMNRLGEENHRCLLRTTWCSCCSVQR